MAIVNAFRIPYVVIHDEDPVPDDCSDDKRASAERTFAFNEIIGKSLDEELGSVHIFSPNFEEATGVSKSQGERKGKALAALDHFEEMAAEHVPDVLRDAVSLAYPSST